MVKRKRILLVDIGAPFGGVETYVQSLASILVNEADIYSICALPELAARLQSLGVRVFCLPILGSRAHNAVRFVITALIFPFYLLRYRIDVVQVNGYLESLLVLPARFLGSTAIRTSHGPSEVELYRWYRRPTKYFPRLASRWFLNFASKVVCVSEAVGREVLRTVDPRRVLIIPNWVSHLPAYERPFHNKRAVQLLFVGRLEEYKGLQLLLEAMRGLEGARLIVLGVGSFRPQLEGMAQGLDVSFTGFCSNPASYYESADIFVNPSLGPEGLPIVSLESMSHGLACIFSELPVHQEISSGGEAAMLFRVGDAADLREKLIMLLSDVELRRTLSAKARDIVKKRYSPEAAREGYLRAFELVEAEA